MMRQFKLSILLFFIILASCSKQSAFSLENEGAKTDTHIDATDSNSGNLKIKSVKPLPNGDFQYALSDGREFVADGRTVNKNLSIVAEYLSSLPTEEVYNCYLLNSVADESTEAALAFKNMQITTWSNAFMLKEGVLPNAKVVISDNQGLAKKISAAYNNPPTLTAEEMAEVVVVAKSCNESIVQAQQYFEKTVISELVGGK